MNHKNKILAFLVFLALIMSPLLLSSRTDAADISGEEIPLNQESNEPLNPEDEDPLNPGDEDTLNPGDEDPLNPEDEDTLNPEDDETLNLGDEGTLNPGDDEPLNEADEDTLNPEDKNTLNPGDDEPLNEADEDTLNNPMPLLFSNDSADRAGGNVVYLNGKSGDDSKDGTSPEQAVQTFARAKDLAIHNPQVEQIIVISTTVLEGDVNLSGSEVKIIRGAEFGGCLFEVQAGTEASLTNIIIDGNSVNNGNIQASLIQVSKGATLNIQAGAVLRNNKIQAADNTITRGGAINATNSTINMSGGTIEKNAAVYGGGVYLYKSTLNFSGGIISDNTAKRAQDGNEYYSAGGGILANEGSTINMSGEAQVTGNYAVEIGGGISLGSNQWGATNILNMTGGLVDGNTAGAAGGGIFVQAKYFSGGASKAYISAGKITNNRMDASGRTNKAFGGGGIYVNGANNSYGVRGANGELYLENVLITGNTSYLEGAGYAACPISKTKIYVTDGAAIYGNNTDDVGQEIYILCSFAYGLHSGNPEYKLSKRMLGGFPNEWKTKGGALLPLDKYEGTLPRNTELALYTDNSGNELTKHLTKVIISGNFSYTRGGGIGSNGTVTFGKSGTTDVSVLKKWDMNGETTPERISVALILTLDGKEYTLETRELSAENDWQTTFSDLPTEFNGQNAVYTVKELGEDNGSVAIDGTTFQVSYEGNMADGFTIVNAPTEPEKPSEPEPEQPEKPSEPEPEQPEKPSEPEPEQPEEPSEPEPEQPEKPSEPEPKKPQIMVKGTKPMPEILVKSLPKTGAVSPSYLPSIVLGVSGLVLVILGTLSRRFKG